MTGRAAGRIVYCMSTISALRDPSTMLCLVRRNRRACRRLRVRRLVRQVFSKVENLSARTPCRDPVEPA